MDPRRPCMVLLDFSPTFSLILLNPEGNRGRKRKGIKFWLERQIDSVGELGFWGGSVLFIPESSLQ